MSLCLQHANNGGMKAQLMASMELFGKQLIARGASHQCGAHVCVYRASRACSLCEVEVRQNAKTFQQLLKSEKQTIDEIIKTIKFYCF